MVSISWYIYHGTYIMIYHGEYIMVHISWYIYHGTYIMVGRLGRGRDLRLGGAGGRSFGCLDVPFRAPLLPGGLSILRASGGKGTKI